MLALFYIYLLYLHHFLVSSELEFLSSLSIIVLCSQGGSLLLYPVYSWYQLMCSFLFSISIFYTTIYFIYDLFFLSYKANIIPHLLLNIYDTYSKFLVLCSNSVLNNTCYLVSFEVRYPGGSDGKASVYNVGDPGPIPGSGRSPGEGNGYPLQHYCLENPMDGGTW